MKINTYVSQRTFNLKDLNEKEMRILYHLFNCSGHYLFSKDQEKNLECEVCPPLENIEEAKQVFDEMGNMVFKAYSEE